MDDVCSVLGEPGRKILNLIKGIEIEPAPQHRSHCTPPHNSREHDERPVPQHEFPANPDTTHAHAGPPGPLEPAPDAKGGPRANADPTDLLRRWLATERGSQRRRDPPDPSRRCLATEKSPQHRRDPPDPPRRRASTETCPPTSVDPADPFASQPKSKKGPPTPKILEKQPQHDPHPSKTNTPARMLASPSPELTPRAARSGAANQDEYVLSKRGEVGAEFEQLWNNLQHCAQLTPLTNAPKPRGNLGTLPQSIDQGESCVTRLACGPVPHPALERGMDENPNPLSGNRTTKTKASDVVVRSPDASSLGDSNLLVNVDKAKPPSRASKWDRRKASKIKGRLQDLETQKAISRCILEVLEQRLELTGDQAKPSPPQSSPHSRQQQTAVERSEYAAQLSCQVSEGGKTWGGGGKSMESSCSLPLPPNWGTNHEPTKGTARLPTWDELEPLASFTSETANHENTHQLEMCRSKLRKELQLRKLIRLPRKTLRQSMDHDAILDSGATSSFIKPDGGAMSTGQPSNKQVRMPNGQTLNTSFKAMLPNTTLNQKARECDILPGLQHNSLISVGKLADAGYCTIFMPGTQGVQVIDGNNVKIHVSGEAVLRGWRDPQGLWRVPLGGGDSTPLSPQQLKESLNNVFDLPSTEQTIRYLHACAGFPTRRTWIKAIKKGNFIGWPMLTVENVNKHFPESEETAKGHMNHQRQGVRSTKPKDLQEPDAKEEIGKKERDVYAKVVDLWNPKETIYTDQTGAFPVTAQSGARYVMVMVTIDANAILVCPIKNRTDQELTKAYKILLRRAKATWISSKKHVLDNECSK